MSYGLCEEVADKPSDSSVENPVATAQRRYAIVIGYVNLHALLDGALSPGGNSVGGGIGGHIDGGIGGGRIEGTPMDRAFLKTLWRRAEEAHYLAGQPDMKARETARAGLVVLLETDDLSAFHAH